MIGNGVVKKKHTEPGNMKQPGNWCFIISLSGRVTDSADEFGDAVNN